MNHSNRIPLVDNVDNLVASLRWEKDSQSFSVLFLSPWLYNKITNQCYSSDCSNPLALVPGTCSCCKCIHLRVPLFSWDQVRLGRSRLVNEYRTKDRGTVFRMYLWLVRFIYLWMSMIFPFFHFFRVLLFHNGQLSSNFSGFVSFI